METYVEILKVLSHNEPMKLTHIMYKANMNCNALKECLEFLIQQDLIEKKVTSTRRNREKIRYMVTEKARTVIKYFNEVNKALQNTKDGSIPALIW